jgi:hypothetical protein
MLAPKKVKGTPYTICRKIYHLPEPFNRTFRQMVYLPANGIWGTFNSKCRVYMKCKIYQKSRNFPTLGFQQHPNINIDSSIQTDKSCRFCMQPFAFHFFNHFIHFSKRHWLSNKSS